MSRHDPNTTLYLVSSIGICDGTIDFDSEAPDIHETEKEAVARMRDQAEEYGLEMVIYRMIPIARVVRKMKLERIKPAT